MSPRSIDPSSPTDEGDFDSQPPDERERAEAKWLLARESDPGAPAPSAEVAKDYEELEHLLATLPEPASDHSWHAEVLRQAAAAKPAEKEAAPRPMSARSAAPTPWWRRPAVRWASSGVVAAAAVVIAVAVFRSSPFPPSEALALNVEPRTGGGVRANEDRLEALHVVATKGDVRIFRRSSGSDGTLIARCIPEKAGCDEVDHHLVFDTPIKTVGTYYVVLVVGKLDIPEDVSMREFTEAARAAGLKLQTSRSFERR
jgi:hypothetical protein